MCALQQYDSNDAQQFLSRGARVIVRMRGLPYDCTAQQVVRSYLSHFLAPDDAEEPPLTLLFPPDVCIKEISM